MSSNFTGSWKANLAKSKFLSPPPKGVVVQIEHSENRLREEIVVFKHDGREERAVFTFSLDREDGHSALNGQPIRGKARWVGNELVIESWMQFGYRDLHFRDCWSLTENGRTLVMEHRDDALAGQLTVLDLKEPGSPTECFRATPAGLRSPGSPLSNDIRRAHRSDTKACRHRGSNATTPRHPERARGLRTMPAANP